MTLAYHTIVKNAISEPHCCESSLDFTTYQPSNFAQTFHALISYTANKQTKQEANKQPNKNQPNDRLSKTLAGVVLMIITEDCNTSKGGLEQSGPSWVSVLIVLSSPPFGVHCECPDWLASSTGLLSSLY